jgi:hypothetical protein
MALGRCTPDPDGLIHHADRRSQLRFNWWSQHRLARWVTRLVRLHRRLLRQRRDGDVLVDDQTCAGRSLCGSGWAG